MPSRAEQLNDLGQSVWLDFIRRGHMESGAFGNLVSESGVVGVTSNPTIFQKAIGGSSDYDNAIERRMGEGLKDAALLEAIMVEDIQTACDILAPVHERTDGVDGRVSIEVNPHLAHDTEGTIQEARRLHAEVNRPNLHVKVPATLEGLPAISALIADGICINVTLIFTLERYAGVMDAYLRGLEQRASLGQPLRDIHSVASFFVSRVDSKVDKAIEERMAQASDPKARETLKGCLGLAAIANARLAYRAFEGTFGGKRFRPLAEKGARRQRPLWASTSTKNPAYRDVLYVEQLIGADTVNTMPLETLDAFNDHGEVAIRIENDLAGADRLFEGLPALGVPLQSLIAELEPEGVRSFAKSYDDLMAALEGKRTTMKGSR